MRDNEYPYGKPKYGEPLTVILCAHGDHRNRIIDKFRIPNALYACLSERRPGIRINTLIVFNFVLQSEKMATLYREHWLAHVAVGGDIFRIEEGRW